MLPICSNEAGPLRENLGSLYIADFARKTLQNYSSWSPSLPIGHVWLLRIKSSLQNRIRVDLPPFVCFLVFHSKVDCFGNKQANVMASKPLGVGVGVGNVMTQMFLVWSLCGQVERLDFTLSILQRLYWPPSMWLRGRWAGTDAALSWWAQSQVRRHQSSHCMNESNYKLN